MIWSLLYYTVMAWCAAGLALLCTLAFAACLQLQRGRTRTRDLERCIRVEPERPADAVPSIDVPAWPAPDRIRVDEVTDAVAEYRTQVHALDRHVADRMGRDATAADITRCVHALRPPMRALSDDWRPFSLYRRN